MICSYIAEGNQPCPFGCKKDWIICHSFLQNRCRHEQWEWCSNGYHTTEQNLKAKNDPRNKTRKEDNSYKPPSERDNRRRSRSRSTDAKLKRASPDAQRNIVLEPKIQNAMITLGIFSVAMPAESTVKDAFKRSMDGALSKTEKQKMLLAFARLKEAFFAQPQAASSSSRDPPSSST